MADNAIKRLCGLNLSACAVGVLLRIRGEDEEPDSWKRVNITDKLADEFRCIAGAIIDEVRPWVEDKDYQLLAHDPGHTPDPYQLEHLKVADHENIARVLKEIPAVATAPMADPTQPFMEHLTAYAIVLEPAKGDRVILLRKSAPSRELGRSRGLAAIWQGNTFDKLDRPVVRFDDKADCIAVDGYVFVRNVTGFQRLFDFYEMLREVADGCLKEIKKTVPIAGFEDFAEACHGNVHKLTKLRNIASKPYLKDVTMKDIKRTIKQFELVGIKVVKKNGQEMLEYDASNRWVLLNLMDDAYLGSVMTKNRYIANSKRAI